MKQVVIETENRTFEFIGELVAESSSYKPQCGKERWSEFKVYKTDTGKFVCQKIGMTEIPGEKIYTSVYVTEEPLKVYDFFKPSFYCRQIFDQLGIEYPRQRIE